MTEGIATDARDDHRRIGRDVGRWWLPRRRVEVGTTKSHGFQEGVMTGYPHDSPIHRPADHSWMLAAWVLPLVVAVGITIVTFGFAAITIAVAIMIGLVSTGLHFWGPSE
jgi:hypothetical protein